jgi:hypothetical protein
MRSSSIFSGQKSDAQKYFRKNIDTPGFYEKKSFSQNEWVKFNFVGCKLRRPNLAPHARIISADDQQPGISKITAAASSSIPPTASIPSPTRPTRA